MLLLELAEEDVETGRYDPQEDRLRTRQKSNTRKPVLLLKDLNRLKRLRALKRLEGLRREDLLGIMYAAPEEGGGGAPGF